MGGGPSLERVCRGWRLDRHCTIFGTVKLRKRVVRAEYVGTRHSFLLAVVSPIQLFFAGLDGYSVSLELKLTSWVWALSVEKYHSDPFGPLTLYATC